MEEINEKILNVFGYTLDGLMVADGNTGISEIFENDCGSDPTEIIHSFIKCCSVKEFEELKIMLNGNDMSTIF